MQASVGRRGLRSGGGIVQTKQSHARSFVRTTASPFNCVTHNPAPRAEPSADSVRPFVPRQHQSATDKGIKQRPRANAQNISEAMLRTTITASVPSARRLGASRCRVARSGAAPRRETTVCSVQSNAIGAVLAATLLV